MIFTVVGTHEQQFDRLVKAVDCLEIDEERIVQYGYSYYRPTRAKGFDFITFDKTVAFMKEARVVISHAGTGSVMLALSLGKRPIVVPRLKRFDEHVDDHQLELVTTLSAAGYIVPLMPDDDLGDKIQAAGSGEIRVIEPNPALVDFLCRFVDESAPKGARKRLF